MQETVFQTIPSCLIVDFTEKDFTNRLVAEINSDLPAGQAKPMEINPDHVEAVAKKRGVDVMAFYIEMLQKGYVDFRQKIVADRFDDLLHDYPEFNEVAGGVNHNRIINRNSNRKDTIHIRKARFEELKSLWSILNRKYVLYFDKHIDQRMQEYLPLLIKDKHVFALQVLGTSRSELAIDAGVAYSNEATKTEITVKGRHYAYNEFLCKASKHTNIPIHTLHGAFVAAARMGVEVTNEMFNEDSLARLIGAVDDWKCNELTGLVCYKQANYRVRETKLTNADGSVKDEVVQAYIGSKMVPGVPPVIYLYDAYAHDSGLEFENIKTEIDEVIVYGKIPSHSICIPTVASSNYSPDFMYVVKKADGTKELNIVIETKAYDKESQMAPDESRKIECAEAFFKAMAADGYSVRFRRQLNQSGVKSIIDELIKE